jgi:hypothetical protein
MKGTLFVAVLLYISLPRTLADGSMRIPRILHRNFMGGAKSLRDATREPRSGFKAHWLDSCRVSCCCYCCCGPLKAAAGYTPQFSLQRHRNCTCWHTLQSITNGCMRLSTQRQ